MITVQTEGLNLVSSGGNQGRSISYRPRNSGHKLGYWGSMNIIKIKGSVN